MPLPRKTPSGAWKVRKRIPDNLRDEYARAYDVKREATKTWPAGGKEATVKQEHAQWLGGGRRTH